MKISAISDRGSSTISQAASPFLNPFINITFHTYSKETEPAYDFEYLSLAQGPVTLKSYRTAFCEAQLLADGEHRPNKR